MRDEYDGPNASVDRLTQTHRNIVPLQLRHNEQTEPQFYDQSVCDSATG
jgi:hypothetical protein